ASGALGRTVSTDLAIFQDSSCLQAAGLLEPVGVHADHRGRGHGTAISVAAAAALRELGASSALVSTPTSNAAAVAAYRAAGYEPSSERLDLGRAA
ncbi:GNAT family N-acetyltransferase, partial [Streptomyces sp. NPDC005904]|uniref:GNAT family N-acetyltransferase n=1 Tax=Streptomyces sp. NPDC005904 TaxID=3154570 RepID=UPI0033F80FE4